MTSLFANYLLVQIPGWLIAVLVLWGFHIWGALPLKMGLALLAAWILKDILLFPAMRRFYQSEPAAGRVVGKSGTAVTTVNPSGFIRVHGELWQARSELPIPEGAAVRVREIRGLILFVSPD